MGTTGTASIARWKNADPIWWLVIVAFAIRTHTSSSVLQKAGVQRNAAFAISSSATDHVVMSAFDPKRTLSGVLCCSAKRVSALSKHLLEPVRCSLLGSWRMGDSTAVRLSAPGAVRHDVAHQVAHVVLQISDDVLDDVSDRDHAHDLARVQHW